MTTQLTTPTNEVSAARRQSVGRPSTPAEQQPRTARPISFLPARHPVLSVVRWTPSQPRTPLPLRTSRDRGTGLDGRGAWRALEDGRSWALRLSGGEERNPKEETAADGWLHQQSTAVEAGMAGASASGIHCSICVIRVPWLGWVAKNSGGVPDSSAPYAPRHGAPHGGRIRRQQPVANQYKPLPIHVSDCRAG